MAKELIKYLDPDGEEKTLIFAATDDHADTVVRVLKEEFEDAGIPIPDEAIAKITGSVDRPSGTIRQFKNERLPNIAVTVDLLTTGIDVPEICNLVFIRRIRSRILFEQMLGGPPAGATASERITSISSMPSVSMKPWNRFPP